MIPPFAWVGELVPFFLRWGHKSQHVCHNVHKKLLVRSLFYTCIYFELTKHLGCGFKVINVLYFSVNELNKLVLLLLGLDLDGEHLLTHGTRQDFRHSLAHHEDIAIALPNLIEGMLVGVDVTP